MRVGCPLIGIASIEKKKQGVLSDGSVLERGSNPVESILMRSASSTFKTLDNRQIGHASVGASINNKSCAITLNKGVPLLPTLNFFEEITRRALMARLSVVVDELWQEPAR